MNDHISIVTRIPCFNLKDPKNERIEISDKINTMKDVIELLNKRCQPTVKIAIKTDKITGNESTFEKEVVLGAHNATVGASSIRITKGWTLKGADGRNSHVSENTKKLLNFVMENPAEFIKGGILEKIHTLHKHARSGQTHYRTESITNNCDISQKIRLFKQTKQAPTLQKRSDTKAVQANAGLIDSYLTELVNAAKTGQVNPIELVITALKLQDKELMVEAGKLKPALPFNGDGGLARFEGIKNIDLNLLGYLNPSVGLLTYLVAKDLSVGIAAMEKQGIPWEELTHKFPVYPRTDKGPFSFFSDLSRRNETERIAFQKLPTALSIPKLSLANEPSKDRQTSQILALVALKETSGFAYISPAAKQILEAGASIEFAYQLVEKTMNIFRDDNPFRAVALKKIIAELPPSAAPHFTQSLQEVQAKVKEDPLLQAIMAKEVVQCPNTNADEIEMF